MPTLYIANTSKQKHDFVYRIPEENGTKRQLIPAGGQITVYQAGATSEVLKSIIDQHLQYGLIDVADIDRRKPFVGLCYRFDKPIDVEKIMHADEHNAGVLTQISQEARKLSAVAAHAKINEDANLVDGFELEIVEQNRKGDPGINETVTVTRDGADPAPRGRGRPRKAA
jgi:hypothetical protein